VDRSFDLDTNPHEVRVSAGEWVIVGIRIVTVVSCEVHK
jgi:hypothetical protein